MDKTLESEFLEGEVIDIHSEDINEFESMHIMKSNTLIRGRYSTSLLANKVTALSMTRLCSDSKGRPTASITAAEIKEAVGWKGGNSIYSQLRQVAIELRTAPIILENGRGSFYVTGMVDNCLYDNGTFTITFSLDMVPHLFDLQKNYTILTIKSLMQFKSNNTYRIYELIREHVYKITKDEPIVCVSYSLSELRAKIGLIDFSMDDKKLLTKASISSKDDDIEKVAKKVKYRTWSEFKRNVLDVARKELMEKSEITFDYAQKIRGRGGKVEGVKFYIHKNTSPEYLKRGENGGDGSDQMSLPVLYGMGGNERKDIDYGFLQKMQEIIEEDLPVTSLIKIMDASRQDIKRIEEVYKIACGTKQIKNLAGFMVTALQEGWSADAVPKMQGMSQEEAKNYTDRAEELYKDYIAAREERREAAQSGEEGNIVLGRIADYSDTCSESMVDNFAVGKENMGEENNKKLEKAFKEIDSLPDELKEELLQRILAAKK